MSSQVEQIKERLGIAEVVGGYIKLEKAGANYKARCPFHNEKTPSFFLSAGRNSYYCFGCGAKGDIFSFVQEFEGLDFVGALKVLAQKAGVELVKEDPKMRSERQRLFLCLESATIFFQRTLYERAEYKEVVDYLVGRGLSKETIKEWRIGYAPDAWQALSDYLKAKRFTESDMEKVGLIKRREEKDGFYDRFRGRITFPLFDSSGRVIGFSGRILKDDGKSAKYLNSPETELFHKSDVLYGFHKAKQAIRQKDFSILVEGQMDMLMSQQAGFDNTVAVSGTALTIQHLENIRRLSEKVVMSFDPDGAGVRAALRGAEMAIGLGMEVRIARLPKGEDPALFILNHPDQWKEVVEKKAVHIVEFMLDHLLGQTSAQSPAAAAGQAAPERDPRMLAKEVAAKVLPFIARMNSSMERSHFVSMVYKKTGIKEEAIMEDLRKIEKSITQPIVTSTQGQNAAGNSVQNAMQSSAQKNVSRRHAIERRLAGIILWQETMEKPTYPKGALIEKIRAALKTITDEDVELNFHKTYQAGAEELILEAELSYNKSEKIEQEVEELLVNLAHDHGKEILAGLHADISRAEREKDMEKRDALTVRFNQLSKILDKKRG